MKLFVVYSTGSYDDHMEYHHGIDVPSKEAFDHAADEAVLHYLETGVEQNILGYRLPINDLFITYSDKPSFVGEKLYTLYTPDEFFHRERIGMAYADAKALKEQRESAYALYCTAHNIDSMLKEKDMLANAPDGIFNTNVIMHLDGNKAGETEDGRVYLYPPGMLACSGIPDEAFVDEKMLQSEWWYVMSKNIDYSEF